MAARQRNGNWTVSRTGGSWGGTLLQALDILKKYLPRDFFPGGELGRAAEHARNKLNKHITKNSP
jgi:hypothetical protein